jgi:HK97 family phage portal protein
MSLMSRLRAAFGPAPAEKGPRNDVSSADIRRGMEIWAALGGGAGAAPSESELMRVTAVHACVQLIAGSIAALPMHIYRRARDGDLTRDYDHGLWWLLNEEWHPRWPASAAWEYLTASKLLHGDGFAEIQRGTGGAIRGLVPLHPKRVRVIAKPDGSGLAYEVQPDSTIQMPAPGMDKIRVLDQDDMLHVAGFGFDGLRGLSAIRYALRHAGGLAAKAQNFSESFLQNMGRPDFVLQSDGTITDAQYEQLKDRLAEHRNPSNAGQSLILEGGLKFQPVTMPLEEMQLVQTRAMQTEEIARAFGVPPFMIGQTEKTSSWGSGVEAMGAGFVRYTLRSHLNAFTNELNRKLFRSARFVAEFDTFELERGDFKSMIDGVRVAMGRAGEQPILSVEEGRQVLRFPKKMTGTKPAPAVAPQAPDDPPDDGEGDQE